MLAELLSLAEIRDIIVSERMKVYEASFNFDLNNAPDYSYFFNIINFCLLYTSPSPRDTR